MQQLSPTHVAARDRALGFLREGQHASARSLLDGIPAELRQTDFASTLALSVACTALRDLAAAEVAVDHALRLQPKNLQSLLLKGRLLYMRQDLRGALSYFRTAIEHAGLHAPSSDYLKQELEFARSVCQDFTQRISSHIHDSMQKSGHNLQEGQFARFRKSLDHLLGRRPRFVQEPQQLFFPELPNIEVFDSSAFPWTSKLEGCTDEIRREVLALLGDGANFEAYVRSVKDRPVSQAHGLADNPDWSALYLIRDGELQAETASRCPGTLRALSHVPLTHVKGRMPSVLFSLLRPGAKIPPHTGMLNTRLICHLPLVIPPGCGLRVGSELIEWQEGKVVIFDDSIEHEAWNNSDQPRLVLIFEIWRPELSAPEIEAVTALLEVMAHDDAFKD